MILKILIEQLPENFPQALPIIQNDIAPIIAECDPGLKDHYISLIKKRTKAASKRAVQLEIENAVIQLTEEDILPAKEPENRIIDPEIKEMAEQIASDPHAFQKPYRDGQQIGRDRRKEKHRNIHGCDRQFASSNGNIWFRGACCKKLRSSRVREIASAVYDIEDSIQKAPII